MRFLLVCRQVKLVIETEVSLHAVLYSCITDLTICPTGYSDVLGGQRD